MYPYPRGPGQSALDAIIDHLSMVGGLVILVGIGAAVLGGYVLLWFVQPILGIAATIVIAVVLGAAVIPRMVAAERERQKAEAWERLLARDRERGDQLDRDRQDVERQAAQQHVREWQQYEQQVWERQQAEMALQEQMLAERRSALDHGRPAPTEGGQEGTPPRLR